MPLSEDNLLDPRYRAPDVPGWIWCGNTEPGVKDEIAAAEVYRGLYGWGWDFMAQPFMPNDPNAQPRWAVYRRRA